MSFVVTRRAVVRALSSSIVPLLLQRRPLAAARIDRNMKFAATEFGDIAYTDSGTGPAALLVHGVFLNSYLWRHVVDRVSDLRRTICVDLLAHGETRVRAGQDISFATQAEMLNAFCAKLGLDQVDLVANDSGGGIAQIFAARHPDRIRTLTLTNCDTFDNWPGEVLVPIIKAAGTGKGQVGAGVRGLLADVNLARTRFSALYEHPELVSEETFRIYLEPLVRTPEAISNLERFLASFDNRQTMEVEPLLKRLNAPTLIVWAMADPTFDVKWAYWLRDTIPGTRNVIRIEGARLLFPEERPEELAAALRSHWGGAGSVAGDQSRVAGLDTEYQAAVKRNDAAAMDRLLADDFVLVNGDGRTYSKADLLRDARSGQRYYEHQEDTDQTVRVWGDTAVVTAKLWAKGTDHGQTFDLVVWFSDTYARTPAGWRYSFGQASLPLPRS